MLPVRCAEVLIQVLLEIVYRVYILSLVRYLELMTVLTLLNLSLISRIVALLVQLQQFVQVSMHKLVLIVVLYEIPTHNSFPSRFCSSFFDFVHIFKLISFLNFSWKSEGILTVTLQDTVDF